MDKAPYLFIEAMCVVILVSLGLGTTIAWLSVFMFLLISVPVVMAFKIWKS